ncbi:trehalose-phosphatase [Brevibacterium sp. 5221]|uniref:Trehalose-phosphate phosphatase n=1 Tax=Brevibacterium rongguiense TaxID=2695267 RepID=A0A6N9HA63_9MICO|nr:trehalose-phosphatase [Brevibacterium rongguiense]MYM20656.1 trehalose-phosphatase [Brevibacterium rongguiense]
MSADVPGPPRAEALRALAHAPSLLIALDFDGVLAPLQDDPATSAPLPESARAVRRLAALPGTFVGYISGRPLEVLRELSQAPAPAVFVGSHGAEEDFSALGAADPGTADRGAGPDTADPLAPDAGERRTLARLDAAFADISGDVDDDGFWMESKPLGRAFHTRDARPGAARAVGERLDEVAAAVPEARVVRGKDVYEFTTRHVTKGDGLRAMLARTGAAAALYVGDDVTDEDAFAVLTGVPGGLGVKVGAGETAAEARIGAPSDVAALLAGLADARAQAVAAPQREPAGASEARSTSSGATE